MSRWDDRGRREKRQKEWRERDRRQQLVDDTAWIARTFPDRRVSSQMQTPLGRQIGELIGRGLIQIAWDVCMKAGEAPERYGLYHDYDGEEWQVISHYVDETNARYKWDWQYGNLVWPPSSLIVFAHSVLMLSYRQGAAFGGLSLDDTLGVPRDPFEEGYAGYRERNEDTCWLNACHWRRLIVEEARRRYREGFYADPFAREPMRRPAKLRNARSVPA